MVIGSAFQYQFKCKYVPTILIPFVEPAKMEIFCLVIKRTLNDDSECTVRFSTNQVQNSLLSFALNSNLKQNLYQEDINRTSDNHIKHSTNPISTKAIEFAYSFVTRFSIRFANPIYVNKEYFVLYDDLRNLILIYRE